MEILTSPKDKIINMVRDSESGGLESDIYLRLLVLKNNSNNPVNIDSITFKVMSLGENIKEITYRGQILSIRAEDAMEELGYYRENIIYR